MAGRQNNHHHQSDLPRVEGLRVSARPFVPNVNAMAFQPGGMYQGQGYYPHPAMYSGIPSMGPHPSTHLGKYIIYYMYNI